MVLSNNALVSLNDVKTYYDLTNSKANDDTFIETLIDDVTDLFENYCSVETFKQTTKTEYLDGTGGKYLFTKNIPIFSVTSIYEDTEWVWAVDTLIPSTDYRIVDNRYLVRYSDVWEPGDQNIKLIYVYGFVSIPGDLKVVCIEEVIRRLRNRNNPDILSKSMPDGSVNLVEKGLMKSTKEVLNKYKRL
jgi:hypothetical protein